MRPNGLTGPLQYPRGAFWSGKDGERQGQGRLWRLRGAHRIPTPRLMYARARRRQHSTSERLVVFRFLCNGSTGLLRWQRSPSSFVDATSRTRLSAPDLTQAPPWLRRARTNIAAPRQHARTLQMSAARGETARGVCAGDRRCGAMRRRVHLLLLPHRASLHQCVPTCRRCCNAASLHACWIQCEAEPCA